MPGAAAKAVAVSSNAAIVARSSREFEIAFVIFVAFIAALLIALVSVRIATTHTVADMYFGHHPAEIFGVVREVIELGSVEVERASRLIERGGAAGTRKGTAAVVAGIQNYVKRLAAAQRDGVGVEFGVVSALVAQKL